MAYYRLFFTPPPLTPACCTALVDPSTSNHPLSLPQSPVTTDHTGSHPNPPYSNPCPSDRATTSFFLADDTTTTTKIRNYKTPAKHRSSRERRRRGSRSVSGRSSDRSGTRRCCSVDASAAHGTCSDFPVALGTDSSGELFGNEDVNWSSDVSEATVIRLNHFLKISFTKP